MSDMRRVVMWVVVGLAPICLVGALVMLRISDHLCAIYDPPRSPGTVISDCFTAGVVFSNFLGVLLIAVSALFGFLGLGFWIYGKNQEAVESRTLNIV